MPLRRGRRNRRDGDAATGDEVLDDGAAGTAPADDDLAADFPDAAAAAAPSRRPLDDSEAGDDVALRRLDLGSVRIPVLPDMEVRVELNEQREPVAASLLHGGSAVQILAFAAPRGSGIWDEVRAEIADGVRADGGVVEEGEGTFGPELRVRMPNPAAGPGQPAEHRLRFVGFDGPRWFLRGVFSGPAATDVAQAAVLEAALPQVVVARGSDPMAPRDPLPLRLPADVAGTPPSEQPQKPTLDPFHRGPEITEIQ
jgi:hypothetical protein